MIAYENQIARKLRKLPEESQKEILQHIEFLLSKTATVDKQKKRRFNFKWEGGLADLGREITSVELQHKIWDM